MRSVTESLTEIGHMTRYQARVEISERYSLHHTPLDKQTLTVFHGDGNEPHPYLVQIKDWGVEATGKTVEEALSLATFILAQAIDESYGQRE